MSYIEGLTIIIPCYNKEETISETLNCLLNQSIIKNKITNVEIICVDDCSEDRTKQIIKNYSDKYKCIRLICNEKNSGVYYTRLVGVQYSIYKYITFIDPDDLAENTYYEELYLSISSSGYDIIQTPSVYKVGDDKIKHSCSYMCASMKDGEEFKITHKTILKAIGKNWNTLWNRIFNKRVLLPLTKYPPYYINFLEDALIIIIALIESDRIKTVKIKSHYIYNVSSNCNHLSKRHDKTRNIYVSKIYHILNSYLLESGNLAYYDAIKKYRKDYLELFTGEYIKSFNVESFNNRVSLKEFEYIKGNYLALIKEIFD